jgi:hypothetical protein
MTVSRPFRRTCRQFDDGHYTEGGRWRYVFHPKFSTAPQQYIRAFSIIQKDVLELFDYVEPADANLPCYSYRIHELHMRACIEVEANCKAILAENAYSKGGDWNMSDYCKLDQTHQLSSYQIRLPLWHGTSDVRTPFASWSAGGKLAWYQVYNAAKHDRHNQFPLANFDTLVNAMCGLVAVLSAQFLTFDFTPLVLSTGYGEPTDGFETAIGNYFHVKFPTKWPAAERYSFKWQAIENEPDPFQNLTF